MAAAKLRMQGMLRLLQTTTMVERRQHRWSSWRSPPEWLEDANMKNVVDACALRK